MNENGFNLIKIAHSGQLQTVFFVGVHDLSPAGENHRKKKNCMWKSYCLNMLP